MEASSSSSRQMSAPHIAHMRTSSSNSIHIQQEATVMSNRNAQIRRDAPPVAIDIRNYRPSPNPTYSDKKGKAVVGRRLSEPPGTSERQNRHERHVSEDKFVRRSSRDPAMAQSNREAMRALADFLTRTPPPETNLMAKDPEIELKSSKLTKQSSFKMFSRMRSKKEKTSETPQRADPVVSVSRFLTTFFCGRQKTAIGSTEASSLTSQACN
jgi:hypothetical protein